MAMFGNRKAYTAPGNLPADFSAELLRSVPIASVMPGDRPEYPMPSLPGLGGAAPVADRKFGTWEAIGTLGDALQAIGGGQPTYLPMLQQQDAQLREERMRQQRRAEEYQNWQRRYDYQAANAQPETPALQKNFAWYQSLPAETKAEFERYQNIAGPPITMDVVNPNGSVTRTIQPRNSLGAGSAVRVSSAADYEKLPVGAQYYDPSGNLRTKGGQ